MARIQIGTESIYYTRTNDQASTTILFIHGSGGNHKSWPDCLRPLGKIGVVLMDLPGHGLSTGSGRSTVDEYVDFIDDFVSAMGLTRVIVAGHSLGGAIVLELALKQPVWLVGLVLVGTGVRLRVHPDILDGTRRDYAKTVDLICRWAFGPDASKEVIDGSRKALLDTDPGVTRGDFVACNAFDIGSQVGDIVYPTLVVSATDDCLTPPKYGAFLNQHIKNSRYCLIQGAGHMMAIEKPEAFMDGLMAFIESLPGK